MQRIHMPVTNAQVLHPQLVVMGVVGAAFV